MEEKNKMAEINYPIVDCVDNMMQRLNEVREAQKKFATYTQEQVDAIF